MPRDLNAMAGIEEKNGFGSIKAGHESVHRFAHLAFRQIYTRCDRKSLRLEQCTQIRRVMLGILQRRGMGIGAVANHQRDPFFR